MTSGSVGSVPPGHVCWTYDDPAVFDARAQRFLLAGLDAGERVRYVTAEPEGIAAARWRNVPRLREALRSGAACGYDRRVLDDRTIEELACLHPAADPDATLFHLYVGPADLVLAGELDSSNHETFGAALTRAHLDDATGELVVRADELRFIDYRSLVHLHRPAKRRGGTVVLRTALAPAARLVELLGLSRIRVAVAR
ncbi:MEDS domain-containing protein [Micromonospora sp. NPDC047548]|uniref:MEDS domain-containing protein n=1 Tax=Micromonospora sp. NPDC047548 TaxID=3155624 RepID=UPI003409F4CC